jgi:hypothetical protein
MMIIWLRFRLETVNHSTGHTPAIFSTKIRIPDAFM